MIAGSWRIRFWGHYKSLHSTYELVKDRPELPASLLAKVTAGRFKNRIPLEIIRDVTRKDLEAFFMYTQAYPVGYMGRITGPAKVLPDG